MGNYIDFIIYLIVLLGSIPLVRMLLLLFFKKSVLKNIGFIFYLIIVFAAILGRISANTGTVHLLWQAPLTAVLLTAAFIYVDRVNLAPVRKVKHELDKIKTGDFSESNKFVFSRQSTQTEIAEMYEAMQEMKTKIGSVLSEISELSASIFQTGEDISKEAQNITHLAKEQSASISEVYLAIKEVANLIAENTDKADKAEKIAKKSTVKIEVSNKNVKKAMDSLQDIAKKVNVIGEISFRTKILSLNADIEAAKAGENGKGFQVVAAEIRKLSEHSRAASEVVEKISQESINMALRTGRIAEQVVPDIKETSDLVKEIYSGNKEQNVQAELIKSSVHLIDNTSHKFTDLSLIMSDKTAYLSDFSTKMMNEISFFSFISQQNLTDNSENIIQNPLSFSPKSIYITVSHYLKSNSFKMIKNNELKTKTNG